MCRQIIKTAKKKDNKQHGAQFHREHDLNFQIADRKKPTNSIVSSRALCCSIAGDTLSLPSSVTTRLSPRVLQRDQIRPAFLEDQSLAIVALPAYLPGEGLSLH